MDIASTFNPGRLIRLSGKRFFVKQLDIAGYSQILAWLDDVVPGYDDRTMPPDFGSPESEAALNSWPGKFLLACIALRGYPELRYEDVAMLIYPDLDNPEDVRNKEIEFAVLCNALYGSRRTKAKEEGRTRVDIAKTWCSPGMAELARTIGGIEAVGRLSLDQYEWLMSDGKVDEHAAPPEAQADMAEVIMLADKAKALQLPPDVIAAYERAHAAFAATGEVMPDPEPSNGTNS